MCDQEHSFDYICKFENLSSKLGNIIRGRTEGDRHQINSLLDDLNALDYQCSVILQRDKCVLAIHHCCLVISPDDTFLVAKGCQLIVKLVKKQQVKVQGKTLSLAINWCIEALKHCADIAVLDILSAMEALLRGNGHTIMQCHELLGENGILTLLLHPDKTETTKMKFEFVSEMEVQLSAVKCLEALCVVPETNCDENGRKQCLTTCAALFCSLLNVERHSSHKSLAYYKSITIALRGLQSVLMQSSDLMSKLLEDALGIVKAYMLFGLVGYADTKPQRVFPTPLAVSDAKANIANIGRGSKIRMRKKHSRINDDVMDEAGSGLHSRTAMFESTNTVTSQVYPLTSDSEFSDSEGGGTAAKIRIELSRIRRSALSFLIVITKATDKKVLFGYWSSFMSDSPESTNSRTTLLACLVKEPSPSVKLEVVNALITLLAGSRIYLAQAENRDKRSTAFTPFSIVLGDMVKEIHRTLCSVLLAENNVQVIIQVLRCMAVLVLNTAYHRLSPGLISGLITTVRPFTKHQDWTVQVASLTFLGSALSVVPSVPEILVVLTHNTQLRKPEKCHINPHEQSIMNLESGFQSLPIHCSTFEIEHCIEDSEPMEHVEKHTGILEKFWLLDTCLSNLGLSGLKKEKRMKASPSPPTTVRVESLQVLTAMAYNYFSSLVMHHLEVVLEAIEFGLEDADVTVCLHSGKLIESLGQAMQKYVQEGGENTVFLPRVIHFWNVLLSGPLISIVQNHYEKCLCSVGCDALATMGPEVFEQLESDKQIFTITLLIGCTADDQAFVKSSAIRALGCFLLFPSIRKNSSFLEDTTRCIIRSISDELLSVRVNASWSLGNLSDALVLNMNENEEGLPPTLFLELLNSSMGLITNSEKLRPNLVRAIGNILKLIKQDMLNVSTVRDAVNAAIDVLIKYATNGHNMKIRWNSCYALGKMMQNQAFYSSSMNWHECAYTTLTELVENFPNFKVRISAAVALASPDTRTKYGRYYKEIWRALLNALDNSYNMSDYSEYMHRDNLVDQICLTLCHLMNLLTKADLGQIQDVLMFCLDTLPEHMSKFHERLLPEKADILVRVTGHVLSLLQLPDLTSDEHSAANFLVSILVHDGSHFPSEDASGLSKI